jgi:hypothetical protein
LKEEILKKSCSNNNIQQKKNNIEDLLINHSLIFGQFNFFSFPILENDNHCLAKIVKEFFDLIIA